MRKEIPGFSCDIAALLAILAVVHGLLSPAPAIASVVTALHRGRSLGRRLLFVLVVAALSHDIFFAFALPLLLPATAFLAPVVPTLHREGYLHDSSLLAAMHSMVNGGLALPPRLAGLAFHINRYQTRTLEPRRRGDTDLTGPSAPAPHAAA